MHRPARGKGAQRLPAGQGARLEAARVVAAVFVLLVVCSLVAAGLGTVVLERQGPEEPEEEPLNAGGENFERSLRDAIEADPGDAQAMASLANLLATEGDLSEAVDWYERALALDPGNARIRLDFATSLSGAGNRPDAELQFRRVLELDPSSVEASFYLAELYREWQPARNEEAIGLYRRVVEAAPDSYLAGRAREELTRLGAEVATPVNAVMGTPPPAAGESSG